MQINTPNVNEARKQAEKLKKEAPNERIIVLAQGEDFNRKVLEMKNIDILLDAHFPKEKDKLKQRASGLNEVLCKIAAKNSIKIGIDLEKIKNLDKKEKAIILARIKQNIMLCKKAKADLIVLGNYDKKAAFSLLLTLGASTEMAKRAVEN